MQIHLLCNYFIDKNEMDELLFLNMYARNEVLMPTQIGTFLHHSVKDALGSDSEQYMETITSSLGRLFTLGKGNLMLMTKVLGINNVKNLDLLEPKELVEENVNLTDISKCYEPLMTHLKIEQEFEKPKSDAPYLSHSPCLNLSKHPECKAYCDWQALLFQELSTLKINAIQRYVYHQ